MPDIGKINHVLDADGATHSQVYAGGEAEGKLVELLFKILTIPVGLAAPEQAIQRRLQRTVHIEEKFSLLFQLEPRLILGAIIVRGDANPNEETVSVPAPVVVIVFDRVMTIAQARRLTVFLLYLIWVVRLRNHALDRN